MSPLPVGADQRRPRILLVEDDARLATLLQEYLTSHGFTVDLESRGDRAVDRIRHEDPALVILDLMLPGLGGFEVCRRAREQYGRGILMLTASKAEVDQAVGLELGADDYVIKPIEPRILLARIRSLLRRLDGSLPNTAPPAALTVGSLGISRAARDVTVDGARVELTSVEFDSTSTPAQRERLRALGEDLDEFDELSTELQKRRGTVSKSTMSAHFSVLQEAGLIEAEKDGRVIYYRLKMSVLRT